MADTIVLCVFACSAENMLFSSTMYHLSLSSSPAVEQLWHRMDLLGIVIVTVGSSVPGIYYIFYCELFLQKLYWAIVSHSSLKVTM